MSRSYIDFDCEFSFSPVRVGSMKPASRIKATIEILSSTHRSRVPLDKCVGDYMRVRRYIGSKDRSNIAERIYDITRAHARLGWWLERVKHEDTPRARVMAWVILGEQADEKRLKDLFDGSRYAPESPSDDELDFARKLIGQPLMRKDMPEHVLVECPPEHESLLRARFGDDFAEEMNAMLQPAPLDLRVNGFLADKEKVMAYLKADGVKVNETALCPWALRCESKAYLSRTKAFAKGWVEIQDEGSQLIAWLCDAQPGMQVLDYCAGAGGKTLALATAMQRKGRIVAMDTDERRLEKGRKRYRKAGVADIIELRSLSDEKQHKWLKRQKGKFDVVLIDAPCSGSGTWRRNPDMRWQTYGPALEELTVIQAQILDQAHKCVKPGGRLVYATCSLFDAENEDQITRFLEQYPDFEIYSLDKSLGLGHPYMRLSPLRHKTDGFFAAVLRRKA
ncbi:MAG: RsmB/NOP family class I SAM-dependent RNA methyltransferase [Alphaproteobacteria bacterium]